MRVSLPRSLARYTRTRVHLYTQPHTPGLPFHHSLGPGLAHESLSVSSSLITRRRFLLALCSHGVRKLLGSAATAVKIIVIIIIIITPTTVVITIIIIIIPRKLI